MRLWQVDPFPGLQGSKKAGLLSRVKQKPPLPGGSSGKFVKFRQMKRPVSRSKEFLEALDVKVSGNTVNHDGCHVALDERSYVGYELGSNIGALLVLFSGSQFAVCFLSLEIPRLITKKRYWPPPMLSSTCVSRLCAGKRLPKGFPPFSCSSHC